MHTQAADHWSPQVKDITSTTKTHQQISTKHKRQNIMHGSVNKWNILQQQSLSFCSFCIILRDLQNHWPLFKLHIDYRLITNTNDKWLMLLTAVNCNLFLQRKAAYLCYLWSMIWPVSKCSRGSSQKMPISFKSHFTASIQFFNFFPSLNSLYFVVPHCLVI